MCDQSEDTRVANWKRIDTSVLPLHSGSHLGSLCCEPSSEGKPPVGAGSWWTDNRTLINIDMHTPTPDASHAYFNKAFWYIESCSSPHLFWPLLFDELSPKYVTAKFLVTAGSFAIKLHCSRPGSTSVWYYVFIFNCSSDLEYAFPVFSSLLQLLKHPRGLLLPLPARPSQFLTVQCNNINQRG